MTTATVRRRAGSRYARQPGHVARETYGSTSRKSPASCTLSIVDSMAPTPAETYLGQQPSKTARAMFEAKLKRVNAMSVRERMELALELGEQLQRLALDTKP